MSTEGWILTRLRRRRPRLRGRLSASFMVLTIWWGVQIRGDWHGIGCCEQQTPRSLNEVINLCVWRVLHGRQGCVQLAWIPQQRRALSGEIPTKHDPLTSIDDAISQGLASENIGKPGGIVCISGWYVAPLRGRDARGLPALHLICWLAVASYILTSNDLALERCWSVLLGGVKTIKALVHALLVRFPRGLRPSLCRRPNQRLGATSFWMSTLAEESDWGKIGIVTVNVLQVCTIAGSYIPHLNHNCTIRNGCCREGYTTFVVNHNVPVMLMALLHDPAHRLIAT